jgi:hypothetical protein
MPTWEVGTVAAVNSGDHSEVTVFRVMDSSPGKHYRPLVEVTHVMGEFQLETDGALELARFLFKAAYASVVTDSERQQLVERMLRWMS